MLIDWTRFAPALVLLLTPGDLCNGAKVRYRDVTRDWEGYWRRTLSHGMHLIDLARAALGTWLLLDSLHGSPDARGLAKYAVVIVQGCIGLIAVFAQTVVCREPGAVNAPFAFVIGLLLAGLSPVSSLFAIALAMTIALGSRTPIAFFPVAAIANFGIGFWFKGKPAIVGLGVASLPVLIPFFWAMMFHRDMVVAHRAKRLESESQLPPPR